MNYRLINALIIISFLFACKSIEVENSIQTTKIICDGSADEWELPLRFYDSKNKLQYSCSNDKKYIYMCIGINDMRTQMKLLRSGMSLTFSNVGGKKSELCIQYPMSEPEVKKPIYNADSALAAQGQMPRKRDRRYLITRIQHSSEEFKINYGKQLPIKYNAFENELNILGGMALDSAGALFYEIQIPIELVLHHPLSNNSKLNSIQLTLTIPGVPENIRARPGDNSNYNNNAYQNSNMRPGNMGMGGMGNMGMGGMGNMGGMSRGMAGGSYGQNQRYASDPTTTSIYENSKLRLKIIPAIP